MPEIEQVLPKYLQIAGYIRDQIVRGDLPPGAEVPSERDLAASWKVARPTAAKALQALRQQGLVESRRGSGTFVLMPHAAPRARERFERAAAMGTMYSPTEKVEFPFAGIVDAPPHVATALGIDEGAPVAQRRRTIHNKVSGPTEMSISWFPAAFADTAPRLLDTSKGIRGGTLPYLAAALDLHGLYARDQVSARLASDEERRVLSLPEPSAVLVYWLVAYESSGAPIQFDEAVYPSERWAFRQEYPVTM
ncbi:GntR family transcriptional regulator [Nocardia otitidiscaviarum]|uniref:GntR family transcriptional regulator n=1 Tax=Nocardia otitidiscaviarum TaxID=1823 RepID=UPI001895CDA0|nr:GntR family transcriptional regulator [Nocardia otitidiscaviarum]MBF6240486.1 GntR family transcriptional regulator [Nocardia otitidiscaviarum]